MFIFPVKLLGKCDTISEKAGFGQLVHLPGPKEEKDIITQLILHKIHNMISTAFCEPENLEYMMAMRHIGKLRLETLYFENAELPFKWKLLVGYGIHNIVQNE